MSLLKSQVYNRKIINADSDEKHQHQQVQEVSGHTSYVSTGESFDQGSVGQGLGAVQISSRFAS